MEFNLLWCYIYSRKHKHHNRMPSITLKIHQRTIQLHNLEKKYFSAGVWRTTSVKDSKRLPPGSPFGKNAELFANVIWLWSSQQLFWLYAIGKCTRKIYCLGVLSLFSLDVRDWLTKYVLVWNVWVSARSHVYLVTVNMCTARVRVDGTSVCEEKVLNQELL